MYLHIIENSSDFSVKSLEFEEIMYFLSNSHSGHKIIKKMKSYKKSFYNNFFAENSCLRCIFNKNIKTARFF